MIFMVGSSICLHHTAALCNRQVVVVITFLNLPELWPLGSFLFCPRITSLKFLSCSPCTVPPFELYSGGVVVPIIASAIFEHICLSSPLLWRIPGPWLIQPRGIEVSFLYRNAGWALQAGICWEALAFKHYTRKWGFGIKAIFIVRPSTSTDHNRGFGPGVRTFEARIADFESLPPSAEGGWWLSSFWSSSG